jgi:hypothetical protein
MMQYTSLQNAYLYCCWIPRCEHIVPYSFFLTRLFIAHSDDPLILKKLERLSVYYGLYMSALSLYCWQFARI